MGEEMGLTKLQQTLKSLCFNTEWKYAVFWKLKQRTRTVLTWEDAYYDNHEPPDPSDYMHYNNLKNLPDGHCLRDPLGLAVAKMSYLVYALGEGIVGQVAVSGKHQWIFADKPSSSFRSSSEFCDGWQTQFSAGIRTVAVVAVAPHGVVQIGSLNKVIEDTKLVTHIRNVFYSLQNSSLGVIPNPTDYTMPRTLCPSQGSTKSLVREISNDMPYGSEISMRNRNADVLSHLSPGIYNDISHNTLPLPGTVQKNAVEVVHERFRVESPASRDDKSRHLLHPKSGIINLEQRNQIRDAPVAYNFPAENTCVDNYFAFPVDKSIVDYPLSPLDLLYSAVWGRVKFDGVTYLQNEELELPQALKMHLGKDFEQISDFQTEVSCIDTVDSFKFSACSELHEALGSAFKKEQDPCAWSESETETGIHNPLSEGMYSSQLTTECESEQLLEAVVANTRPSSSNSKSEGSLCKSAESLLTTEETPQAPNHIKRGGRLTNGSVVQSSLFVEDGTHHHSYLILESTEICTVKSPKESSSKTASTCGKQLELQVEPAKINRKRARPSESCRPRPRDRQLIQDRVKELRELVPNGSKCSIDSLLERTIKHMLFLQSVTKHADKLKSCAASKFHAKRMGLLGSCNREYGSSWALEMGNETQGCPIVVENLNMNGQMLIEMLCKDCIDFLEIAEAIRRLGLVILEGVAEVHGEKTWACFVVEGQNNRSMHRMDILCSLMQLLQPKTTI
ncbi:Myc-type [Macleaya cordata]|uniref:Myc-type n=1 Tax=Macleaya cordata TaxID=56857 RepID=A0A200QF93_MACCD|nr:Myc-type [Macleaya cordata]